MVMRCSIILSMGIGYLKRFFCRTNNITPMMFANFGFYMRIFVSRLSGNLRKEKKRKNRGEPLSTVIVI